MNRNLVPTSLGRDRKVLLEALARVAKEWQGEGLVVLKDAKVR